MKKFLIFILPLIFFLIPKDTFAQQIYNTGVTLKNSDNTQVLYSGGINEEQSNIAYLTGKIEFPFSTSVNYDNSYSFTMDYYINIPYNQSYQNLGFGNPELYVNSNGLVQQTIQISNFGNTLQACGTLACTYRINLSFTFGSTAAGTIYLAIPVTPPHPIYGWHYNNIDLTSYGQNTSNSDIINNNNQNTQNIINNNNQTTQQIINNNNSNTQEIKDTLTDDTPVSNATLQAFIDDFPVISNGPISGILQVPLRFLDYLTTIFASRNCGGAISLGTLLNNEIKLQCIDVESHIGSNIYTFVDYVGAILIYYLVLMNIISCWETWTNFEDNFNSLYVGKHTRQGYTPRHGGDS